MLFRKGGILGIMMMGFLGTGHAADDASIQGNQRESIQKAIQTHIEQSLDAGRFVIFDGKAGVLRRLSFDKVHPGIVRNGGFYASCADFSDGKTRYDVDFLVTRIGDDYKVMEALIHKVDAEKRPYRVE